TTESPQGYTASLLSLSLQVSLARAQALSGRPLLFLSPRSIPRRILVSVAAGRSCMLLLAPVPPPAKGCALLGGGGTRREKPWHRWGLCPGAWTPSTWWESLLMSGASSLPR
ncbi:hypothetical protein H1C71_012297, partial [Ictidomys tridecemlineatus]